MKTTFAASIIAGFILVSFSACSSGNGSEDVIADTIADLVSDVEDTVVDDAVVDDAGPDVAADLVGDTGSDSAGDTLPDVPGDSVEDVVKDAVSDLGQDTGNDAVEEIVQPLLWENLVPAFTWTVDESIGVSTHMYQGLNQNDHTDFEFEKYAELGPVTIREDFRWRHFEASDDVWDMDCVRGQVNKAMAQDMHVTGMFGYEMAWAMSEEGNYSSIDMAEYGEFVGTVAAEYCDQVMEYEIWNEENIPRFWKPKPDPEAYGYMLKASYTAVKEACPEARVLFGGIASYDAETDLTDRYGFLERVWEKHPDICIYFDIVAFHPYTFLQYDSPERDVTHTEELVYQSQSRQTDIVKSILAKMGCPDKSLMITEQGWPSYELSEEQVGRFLPRSLILAIRDGVEKWMWYTFWDGYPTTEGIRPHEDYFGLFGYRGEDGTVRRAKPAWYALKAASDIIGDMKFARDISPALDLPNDVYAMAFTDDSGKLVVAAWDGRDMPDQSWGVDAPGGPDTTYEMTMPLPDGFSGVTVYDIAGEIVDPADYSLTRPADMLLLTVTVSPAVRYIEFTKGSR